MHRVTLHVYDLSQGMARSLSMQFLGAQIDIVPHTGIVVYGQEFFYSGGIQILPSDEFSRTHMPTCEVLTLGETEVPQELFEEFLSSIAADFTAEKYNLMKHNCKQIRHAPSHAQPFPRPKPQPVPRVPGNHFSEECAQFLIGASIPESIRAVPDIVMATPMGAMFAAMFEQQANSFDPLVGRTSSGSLPLPSSAAAETFNAASILDALGGTAAAPPSATQAMQPRLSAAPTPTADPSATPATSRPVGRAPLETPITVRPALSADTPVAPTPSGHDQLSQAPHTATPQATPQDLHQATPLPAPQPAPQPTPQTSAHGAPQVTPVAKPPLTQSKPPTTRTTQGEPMATPLVTPTASTPASLPRLYPSMQPLTSAGGPTAGVLHKLLASLDGPGCPLLPSECEPFCGELRRALEDPKIIEQKAAAVLSGGFASMLRTWRAPAQFGALYLARLLAASSVAISSAMLVSGLPAILVATEGGALAADASAQPEARGARMMALALLSNLATRVDGASALLASQTRQGELAQTPAADEDPSGTGISTGTGTGGAGVVTPAVAASLIDVAVASMQAADGPLAQLGAALCYNLSLHLPHVEDGTDEVAPRLLSAAISALTTLADAEALGRALSVVGHILHSQADEALGLAASLDAANVLAGLTDKAAAAGHAMLLTQVRKLLT